jgi:hypothetical protein
MSRHSIKNFTHHIKNICAHVNTPIIEIADGDKKKRNVFSLVSINDDTVRVESYEVYTVDEITKEEALEREMTLINAEDYFVDNNKLWVGDIKKIFLDYTVTLENKCGPVVWCGTPYRSTIVDFYVALGYPVMVTNYYIATLERLSKDKSLTNGSYSITTDEGTRLLSQSLESISEKAPSASSAVFTCDNSVGYVLNASAALVSKSNNE